VSRTLERELKGKKGQQVLSKEIWDVGGTTMPLMERADGIDS